MPALYDELMAAAGQGDNPPSTDDDQAPGAPPEQPTGDPPAAPSDPPAADPAAPPAPADAPPPDGAPSPTAAPSGEPAPEPPQSVILDRLRELSPDLADQFTSDDEFLRSHQHLRARISQRDEEANLGRMLRENPQAVFQHLAQQYGQQQTQPPPGQQTQHAAWQQPGTGPTAPTGAAAPRYTMEQIRELQDSVVRDDNGQITGVKAGADPNAAAQLRAAERWAQQRQYELLFNPEKVFGETLQQQLQQQEQRIREQLHKDMEARAIAQQHQSQLQNLVEQNRSWLVDPDTGKLSTRGAALYRIVSELQAQRPHLTYDSDLLMRTAMHELENADLKARIAILEKRNGTPTPNGKTAAQPNSARPQPNTPEEFAVLDGESLFQALHRTTGIPLPE